jgi:hypothetical protein
MNFYTINENRDGSYTCSHVDECEQKEDVYSVNMNNDLFEVKRCFIFEFLPEKIRAYFTHLNNYINDLPIEDYDEKKDGKKELRDINKIRDIFEIKLNINKIKEGTDSSSKSEKENKRSIINYIENVYKNRAKILYEKIDKRKQYTDTEIINDYNNFIESIYLLYNNTIKNNIKKDDESMENFKNRILPSSRPASPKPAPASPKPAPASPKPAPVRPVSPRPSLKPLYGVSAKHSDHKLAPSTTIHQHINH